MPLAKWANLTSLVRSTNFTAKQLHFHVSENFTYYHPKNKSVTHYTLQGKRCEKRLSQMLIIKRMAQPHYYSIIPKYESPGARILRRNHISSTDKRSYLRREEENGENIKGRENSSFYIVFYRNTTVGISPEPSSGSQPRNRPLSSQGPRPCRSERSR